MKLHVKRIVVVVLILLLVSLVAIFVFKKIETKIYFGDMRGEILYANRIERFSSFYDAGKRKVSSIYSSLCDDMRNSGIYHLKRSLQSSDEYIGVNYESKSADSICIFSQDDQGQFVVENKILTVQHSGDEVLGLAYAPQFIPNSNAISFKKDGFYWIYNLDDQTTTPVEIENAYSLVWLDDHTFLYTVADIEQRYMEYEFRNVSIRKHDLETNIDSLYLENAYGCSLSSNRAFLAYGIADQQNDNSQKIVVQSINGTQKQEVESPAPSAYNYFPYRHLTLREDFVDLSDGESTTLTSMRYREWNSIDVVNFQPSPDGKYLVFSSDYSELGYEWGTFIIHCQTGKKMPIDNRFAHTLDWTE